MSILKSEIITLSGFSSSGKTSLGRYIAQRLMWNFYDVDELITNVTGENQDKFIEKHGWEAFRDLEFNTLKKINRRESSIISTGGELC